MRIERLDLIAYGRFEGRSLDGLGAPGVHLVHGANEAGKSTTLSALDQLLYGIDHNCRYAFAHGGSTRLGARLSTTEGVALEIVRRKKRKNSLVDAAGEPLGEDALAPFLGDVGRQTFVTEFALGSDELRRGGELLSSGEGDLAQLMAAARSGMRLNTLLEVIEERQKALYLRRGHKPSVNAGLGRLRNARQDVQAATLRPEQYRDAERAVADAELELANVSADLRNARQREQMLQLLKAHLPALDERREVEQRIAAIRADGPAAPDDIREQAPGLFTERSERLGMAKAHTAALADIDARLAEVEVDETLLRHGASIDRLNREVLAILEAVDGQRSGTGEAELLRTRAEARLRTVHPDASLTDTALYRVPRALLAKVKELRDQGIARRDALRLARGEAERRRHAREQAGKQLAELPPLEDVSELQAALDAVPRDLLTTMTDAEIGHEQQELRFRQLVAGLALPDMAPADLLHLRLPSGERLAEVEARDDELAQEERDLDKEVGRAQRELDECRAKLSGLTSGLTVPSHDQLRALRAGRDELIAVLSDDPAHRASLRAAVREADEAADGMVRHAKLVASRTALDERIAALEALIPRHRERLAELAAARTRTRQDWAGLWETFPADAPAIGGASALVADVDRLKDMARTLAETRIELDRRGERLAEHAARLEHLLRPAQDGRQSGDRPSALLAHLAELLEAGDARLAEHRSAVARRAEAEQELGRAEAELADAEAAVAVAERERDEHARTWRQFLTGAGLPAERDLDTALADVESLLEVAKDVDEAERIERGAARDEQRIGEFERLLQDTLRACRRDVPTTPLGWEQAVETLARDLREHRNSARRRDELQENRQKLSGELEQGEAELRGVDGRLQDFAERVEVGSFQELEAAVRRAEELREQASALMSVQKSLPRGRELDVLVEQAEQCSLDDLGSELAELRDDIAGLEERKDDSAGRLADARRHLDGLDGSGDAARAEQEFAQICAALADDAEEYLRLETARLAIVACMEEYRHSDQDSVLARASALFEQLSLGRYSGLELSDEERPSVRARTSGGHPRTPGELSEGTRDQLYLALRLATLERHADAGNTLPIAVDDIFMTFDEARTDAALHVLDGMADRFQVIVFTHHEHVVHNAEKTLPAGRCHVHRLTP
ncbi:AAA family ATPase [Spirillospora sp. NPDC052242]